MAVEIPVYIDIDQAFKDAASRVGTAIKPLQSAIENNGLTTKVTIGNIEQANDELKELNDYYRQLEAADWSRVGSKLDLSPYINQAIMQLKGLEKELAEIQELRKMEGGRGDFSFAEEYKRINTEIQGVVASISALQTAERQLNVAMDSDAGFRNHIRSLTQTNTELLQMREYYRQLEQEGIKMGDSINAIRGRVSELNSEWNRMTKAERESERGRAVYNQYKQEVKALEEEARALGQVLQKERERDRIIREGLQKRSYENAVLNATANSMHRLSEQARILQERLERAKFGTKNYDALKERLAAVRAEMQKMEGATTRATAAMTSQSTVLRNLTSMASMYISLFGAFRFAKQIRDVTGELEYQRVALGHLIQDEEYGAALFEKIKQQAVKSPFRIKDLVTYTKQLAAYQIEEENLFDTTKRLADISAGLGVDMNRLILAYGQVRAASVLRGQELRQFTEAGIPLVELLADKMGELNKQSYTTADVFKLISARAVPFSAIADIFEDLTDKGGMFYKMQEEQAKTLKGRWEKLKDTYDIALQSIGESKGLLSFMTYNNLIIKSLESLAKGLRIIPKILEGGAAAWLIYTLAVTKSRRAIREARIEEVKNTYATQAAAIAKMKGVKASKAYTEALIRQKAATTMLSRSMWGLWAAMVANPVGAVISAVVGLATAFLSFRKNTESVITDVARFKEAVEGLASIDKDFSKTEKLIDTYEELASKTDKTKKENDKLYSTMSKLSDIFPDMSAKIKDETASLEENIEALREKNKENREAAIQEAKDQLRAAEIKKASLENELHAAEEQRASAYKNMKEQDALVNFWHSGSQKKLDKTIAKYEEWDEKVQSIKEALNSIKDSIDAFENFLNPKPIDEQTKAWKEQLAEMNNYTTSLGSMQIFTPQEITDLKDVYDLYKSLNKIWTDAKVSAEGLKKAYEEAIDPVIKARLLTESADAEAFFQAVESLRKFYGFDFKKSGGGGGSQTDPFITLMQNRIKFMQDFKKGYDDLRKYMTESSALGEEAATMLGRGKSLGMEAEEQVRAAKEISAWYQDMITQVQDKLKAKGVKGMTVTDFLGIDTSKKSKAIQDLQKLLQQLWDAKTDFDTSQKKKEIEDAMKKLSEKIKQSETARNFYQDIFDMTGDQDLSTSMTVSIYGGVGDDFKTRMAKELQNAMKSIDKDILTDGMRQAFEEQDFSKIFSFLDKLPEDWQKRLREMAAEDQKFNADLTKNLLKSLEGAKTYGEKRVELARQTAKRTAEIESMKASDSVKNQLLKQNAKKEAEESAKLAYEAFKDTPMYVELFSNLDAASTKMLRNMRENLISMKGEWKDLTPTELKELQSRINELDEQISRRNPFKTLIDSIKEYRELQAQKSRKQVDEEAIDADKRVHEEEDLFAVLQREYEETVEIWGKESELAKLKEDEVVAQGKILDKARQEADAAQEAANKYKEVGKHILDAAKGMREWSGYISDSLEGVGQIVETFASADTAETFNILAEGIGKTLGGAASAAEGVGKLMTGDISGIADIIRGTGDFIAGTFGTANRIKIKSINKQIESQQDLLDSLETSYGKLDRAIAKAFGSDYIYNYNEQLKNLYAQQEAYRAQARLEDQKGKKKDEQKIKDYNKSAEELGDQIEEMKGKLSEFFTGTDVTSAAQEFANSWIEAYKEFGSTTSAMKERFQDMIQNMITQSLAGKIMQEMLQPIFDEIDSLAQDGDLTAAEIAKISDMANEKIPLIDDAMTNLMNSLAASGMTVRQRVGSFTGISRDIASASEESILGLAAGVNTANFYMSHLPDIGANVAAIKAYLVGDGTALPGRQSTRAAGEEGPSYQDQMLAYAAYLPQMGNDVSAVRSLLDKVIKPRGVSATHYIAIQ